MSEAVKIRDIEAKLGTKSFGYLKVHESDTLKVDMPLGIVNGAESGPTLALTGAIFPTQFVGIEAAIRTYNEIDPKELKGVVLIVPVVDMICLQEHIKQSVWISKGWTTIDGVGVYPSFPGRPDGKISEIIAYTLFQEVILRSQYHIDLRGGDEKEMLISFTIYSDTGDAALDAKTKAMAYGYGTEVVLHEEKNGAARAGSLLGEACRHGVASITALAGRGQGRLDEEDVEIHMTGIENVMKYLGMLKGTPKPTKVKQRTEIPPVHYVSAKHGGLFYPKIEKWRPLGANVVKGELLGEIKSLKGEVLEEIRAPIDGSFHLIFHYPAVRVGDRLMSFRRIREE